MEILARKISAHESFPNVGYIEALFKIDPKGQIIKFEENELNKNIEIRHYNEVNSYFLKGALFKINITQDISDHTGLKYIANGQDAIKVENAAQLIKARFPDRNDKDIYLSDEHFPGTKVIFVVDEQGECYGPLEWEIKNKENKIITLKKISSNLETFKLPEEFVHEINIKDIWEFSVFNDNENVFLVTKLVELGVYLQGIKKYFDYSSDQEIISFFTKKLNKRNTPINEITPQHLANSINKNIYSKDLIQHKIDLLKEINNKKDLGIENIFNSIESFFLTENGKQVIETYVKNNKDNIDKIINIEKETEFSEQIKEKEAKLRSLNDRIEEARKALVSEQNSEITLDNNVKLDSNLQNELDELRDKLAATQSLEYIKWEKGKLRGDIEELNKEKDEAQYNLAEIKANQSRYAEEINGLISDARTSALEFKIFWEAYNQKPHKNISSVEMLNCDPNPEVSKIMENIFEAQQVCIDTLHNKITKNGSYQISKLMLANLMLATQQTFITFLAGPPGVGKTSLAKEFCKHQNISKRLLNVAVSRGWTSQRDLIGFYNPLNESFQVSSTGVYSFLNSISNERFEDNQPTAYILLDEANLSPIEHYWSSFMGQSDYPDKSVNLGNQILKVPNNIRFIATINYDETTERLSPRILNRSTIIYIDNNLNNDDLNNISLQIEEIYPIGYKEIELLFGRSQTPSLKNQEDETFKKIIHILESKRHDYGRPVIISHRKKDAIRQYCHKGRNLLEMYSDNPLTALDLAVKQHILPLISGYGSGLQKRLNDLYELFDQLNLELSKSHLREMIEYGNLEMTSYDFFNI